MLNTALKVKHSKLHYNGALNVSELCEAICRKALLSTCFISRCLADDKQVLVRAYKSYVRPLVKSGTSVFYPYKRFFCILCWEKCKVISLESFT